MPIPQPQPSLLETILEYIMNDTLLLWQQESGIRIIPVIHFRILRKSDVLCSSGQKISSVALSFILNRIKFHHSFFVNVGACYQKVALRLVARSHGDPYVKSLLSLNFLNTVLVSNCGLFSYFFQLSFPQLKKWNHGDVRILHREAKLGNDRCKTNPKLTLELALVVQRSI